MKLVLVLLSAAFLALSSAATTQRPVDEKDVLSSIKKPLQAVINDKDLEKVVDEAFNEEFGNDAKVPNINDEEIEKIVDETFKIFEETGTDDEEPEEEEFDENEIDDETDFDDDEESETDDDEESETDDDEESETDDDEERDGSEYVEGINVEMLTNEELESLMEAQDELLAGHLDVYVGAKEIEKKFALIHKGRRPKRWVPLAMAAGRVAFSAGRAFLGRFARNGITRSGSRITKHYSRPGNYFTGLREFKNLNPTNVKKIGGSKFNGWTGTSGPYRVTVRSGSKGTNGANGSPTLSISSKGGDLVRKFRFD